jgi:hypothetical protein
LKDVFYVPTITKNFVLVGQMMEQGLQMTFNPNGCFVKDMKTRAYCLQKIKGMDECSPWMWTCLKWISYYSHMENQLETLEFGTSELAMSISNVLNLWKNKILLEVFPNLEQKRWCKKFVEHANWGSKLGIHSQL